VVLVGLALWSGQAGWTRTGEAPGGCEPDGSVARRIVAAGLTVAILAAALATPVVVLARQAGRWRALPEAIWDARRQPRQTLYYVTLASPGCAALAAVLAGHWVRSRRLGRFSPAPLVLLNLTVPPALLAIGVIELTRAWPLRLLRDPSWHLVVAYVARFLPVATLAFYTAWRNDSPLPSLAARVHGASRWRTAWRVSWPRRRWEALAVALLCGVLIATELEMSVLLAPPGGATLGIRLYTLIHTAPDSVVSTLTLAMLALLGPVIALPMLLLSRSKRQGGTAE